MAANRSAPLVVVMIAPQRACSNQYGIAYRAQKPHQEKAFRTTAADGLPSRLAGNVIRDHAIQGLDKIPQDIRALAGRGSKRQIAIIQLLKLGP